MTLTFQINRAHVRDLTKVKPLWKQMVSDYAVISQGVWQVLEPGEAWQRRLQEYLSWINDATGVLFLATHEAADQDGESGSTVVGYAALRFLTSGSTFDTGETEGVLESLVVLPEHRGQGIASALLAACRKELERREISHWSMSTLVGNEAAVALATKAGFAPFMICLAQKLDDR